MKENDRFSTSVDDIQTPYIRCSTMISRSETLFLSLWEVASILMGTYLSIA